LTTGIWPRIRLISFTVSFKGRREEGLSEKLASEASGILNWLLAGCLAWQRDGLGDANAMTEATREYREEEDPYLGYFEGVLVPDENGRVEQKVAYGAFQQWQRANDVPSLSNKEFPKRAEARGYRKRPSIGKKLLLGCRLVRSDGSDDSGPVSPESPTWENMEIFGEND
jgi:putative DNA primase/helicase